MHAVGVVAFYDEHHHLLLLRTQDVTLQRAGSLSPGTRDVGVYGRPGESAREGLVRELEIPRELALHRGEAAASPADSTGCTGSRAAACTRD